MNIKSKIGIGTISLLAIVNIAIWFIVRRGTLTFADYATSTRSLGQIAGLVGMTLFALTFVLTTRLKFIENIFGGLDKMYKTHHLMGATAFVLLFFHPILLVLNFIPSNIKQAAIYLWPSKSWAVNFGIIALLGMALLVILTLYINMKYPNWKISHKFMGLVLIIALFHIFLVTTDIMFYAALRYYMILISTIGVISYLYSAFIGPKFRKKYIYQVESVENKGQINIIEMNPKKEKLSFNPGQFVFLRFKDKEIGTEQHPFTIASSPLEKNIRFAIKDLGDFTQKLSNLKEGSIVEIEGPYGKFNNQSGSNQVWIAGGIGITPFLSMIEHINKSRQKISKVDFYYCTKNKEEAVFLTELVREAKNISNLSINPWFSDEKGRINADIIEKNSGIQEKKFLICGPQSLMSSLSGQLIKKGVSKSDIIMEDFDIK